MNSFRKYLAVLAVPGLILVLIIQRTAGNHFRPDAIKRAMPSFTEANIVTSDQASDIKGDGLLIDLDASGNYRNNPDAVEISPDSILEKRFIRMIRRNKGPVILYSEDPAKISGTWMVLSQVGIRNVYILSETKDDEVLKNEFRPDTLFRPEL